MNIINKLLLLLSLSMTPCVTVSAQTVNNGFDTFQTIDKYKEDFDYLTENSYRESYGNFDTNSDIVYVIDYSENSYVFYVIPIYYNIVFTNRTYNLYYQNEYYNFFVIEGYSYELITRYYVENYNGIETEMPFLALDYIGMNQVIDHDYTHDYYDTTIYGSFYKFFTGFFPEYVVNEYHGIFTFIVVGFLLFLVFGFVFFLFRVIRRLVGFK